MKTKSANLRKLVDFVTETGTANQENAISNARDRVEKNAEPCMTVYQRYVTKILAEGV